MSDKPCMQCAYGEYFTDCDQELLIRAEKAEQRIAELEAVMKLSGVEVTDTAVILVDTEKLVDKDLQKRIAELNRKAEVRIKILEARIVELETTLQYERSFYRRIA